MLRGNRKYIFLLALCFGALILLQITAPKPLNWSLSYKKNSSIPFGSSALFDVLPSLFPGQDIRTESYPVYNALAQQDLLHTNYIIINESFVPDELDTRELLEFAHHGNHVLIASNFFGGKLADTLRLKTDNFFDLGNSFANDSAVFHNMYRSQDSISVNFVNPRLKDKEGYWFTRGFENSYFSSFDSSRTTIVGKNASGDINFIRVRWGQGSFLLCSVPEAFTNYHFVAKHNHEYAAKALSCLPLQDVIWDEYYKVGNVSRESPLRFVFSQPALRTAYSVTICAILIFMLLGIKRRQRIIPIQEPLRNTTLQFVDVVGSLYYQTGDHKNIADKKIRYFLEYIRTTFQVKTILFDDAFINRISNLSGIDRQKVHDLFYYFSDLGIRAKISQAELLKLNKMIEDFHRESKR